MEIFEVNEEELGVMEEAFSVGKDVLLGLESSDELLELEEYGVVGGGLVTEATGPGAVAQRLSLVAVVDRSLVPT